MQLEQKCIFGVGVYVPPEIASSASADTKQKGTEPKKKGDRRRSSSRGAKKGGSGAKNNQIDVPEEAESTLLFSEHDDESEFSASDESDA